MEQNTTQQLPTKRYVSPTMEIITMNVRSIICGSERQNLINTTEMDEGDDNW